MQSGHLAASNNNEANIYLRVAVIGTGYVGLTTGAVLAWLGHQVVGVDKDPAKLAMLMRGTSPIHEPGLNDILAAASDRIRFTGDCMEAVSDADIVIVAVGTPSKINGAADTSYLEEAVAEVAAGFRDGGRYTIAVKSTVPIGTSRRVAMVVRRVIAERGVQCEVQIASNPEFLSEERAVHDTLYPDRIVVGAEKDVAVGMLQRLYRPILEQSFIPPPCLPRPEGYVRPIFLRSDPTSAELIKYAANAFLAVKISFANEVAGLCERAGADIQEVARGIGADRRIGPAFLNAGFGWGGSCLPKDTAALLAVAAEYGYEMPIVEAARTVNVRQRLAVVEKLQGALKVLRGRTIGVLGLAFKPGTDDVREAPAIELIRMLVDRSVHVRAHDPMAIPAARRALEGVDIDFVDHPYGVAEGADALVLATEWPVYSRLNLARLAQMMTAPILIDARNLFSAENAKSAGFVYIGIGR